MELLLYKIEGQVGENFQEYIGSLPDGKYLARIFPLSSGKAIRDYQNKYFLLVDSIVDVQGEDKQSVHESLKAHAGISTTKSLTEAQWIHYLELVKQYAYNNLDIIL